MGRRGGELEGKTTNEMKEIITQKGADAPELHIPLKQEVDKKCKVNVPCLTGSVEKQRRGLIKHVKVHSAKDRGKQKGLKTARKIYSTSEEGT